MRAVLVIHEHVPGSEKSWAKGDELIGCVYCHELDGEVQGIGWCATLRALAWPYRSSPGYDQAWAPLSRSLSREAGALG